jgi:pimeloyl-ACP methyl ester carboxylesterase
MPVYAARHAEHVRSIVLSGAYPLDFDPWGRPQIAAARRAIGLVCARTRRCDGARVLRQTARLARRLRDRPVATTVRVGDELVPYQLGEGALASLLYAPLDASVFGRIPAAVRSALAGDLAPLARLNEHSLALFSLLRSQDPQVLASFSSAANAALSCHDYPRVYSFADPLARREAVYAAALARLDRRAFWPLSPQAWSESGIEGADACIAWPDDPTAGRPLPPGTPLPDVPVLVLSGDLDTNTPSAMGRQAAAQFPHARFAEVPNVGHTPSDSACGAALGLRFVKTLSADTRACAGTGAPPPFLASPPTRAAAIVPAGGSGTLPQRRALGLVQLTVADLRDARDLLEAWGGAAGLRGGRYAGDGAGPVALRRVRIVAGATVSGRLTADADSGAVAGRVRIAGRGLPTGALRIRIDGDGRGRARGTLDGAPVALTFGEARR